MKLSLTPLHASQAHCPRELSLNRFPGKAWGRGETPSPCLRRGTETEGD